MAKMQFYRSKFRIQTHLIQGLKPCGKMQFYVKSWAELVRSSTFIQEQLHKWDGHYILTKNIKTLGL